MAQTNTNKHWALQRKLLMNTKVGFNAEVYRHFKEVDNDAATSQSRKTLRDSLLINNKDSRTTAMFKVQYFREQVQKVQNKPAIIGTFKDNFDSVVTYKCRIELVFAQDRASVPQGETPIEAEMGWRIDETSLTLTKAKLTTIAKKIKTEFGGKTPYKWDKGKLLCLYKDKGHGYDFQLYARTENEGENVIKKIVTMNGHSYDEDMLRVSTPKKSSVNNPGTHTILGQSYKKAKWRPTVTVEFQYAQAVIHGLPEPVILLDMTGTKSNPIVKAY